MQVSSGDWRRDRADIDLLLDTMTALVSASPTFSEVVGVLKAAPNLMLLVHPITSRGQLGRGRYFISGGRIVGFVDINVDRLQPRLRVRAIAHELAHATEIVCQAGETDRSGANRGESFAHAVEETVLREYLTKVPAPEQLASLAVKYGLSRCVPTDDIQARAVTNSTQ